MDTLPKWAGPVLALVGAVIALAIAIGIGNRFYYQVHPLTSTSTPIGEQPVASISAAAFDQAVASAQAVPNPEQQCSYFSADDPTGSLSTTTLAQMGQNICDLFEQKAASVIQYPLHAGSPSVYTGGEGAYNGVGIVTSDRTYLVSFSLFKDKDTHYQVTLNHATILKTTHVSSLTVIPIPSSVADSQLLQVSGTDASGNPSEEYFSQYYGRYSDGSFSIPVAKNSDGSFSNIVRGGQDSDPAKVSFLIPYAPEVDETSSDRDYGMETQTNVHPLYHQAACGLEETYGDMAFWVPYDEVTITINFGYASILHITTATQGYVPEQWGTVLSNISMADFRTTIQTPKAFNSASPVEVVTIAGYAVKHIGPIIPDRTCQYQPDQTYDMYQAVKNGAVVTITVTNDSSSQNGLTSSSIQKMMAQVLTTLTFSPR